MARNLLYFIVMRIKNQIWLIIISLFLITLLPSCYVKTPILDPLFDDDNSNTSPTSTLSGLLNEVRSQLNTMDITIIADELNFETLAEDDKKEITKRLNEISDMKEDYKNLKETLVPEKDRYEAFGLTLHLTENTSSYAPPYKHIMINTKDNELKLFLEDTNRISDEIKNNIYTFDSISPQHKWDLIHFLVEKNREPESLVKGIDFHSETTNTETNGERIRLDVSESSDTSINDMNNLLLYHSYLSVINSEYDDEKEFIAGRRISISTKSTTSLSRSKIEQVLICHDTSIPSEIDNIIMGDESKLVNAIIRNSTVAILYLDVRSQSSIPENPSCKELAKYVITLLP